MRIKWDSPVKHLAQDLVCSKGSINISYDYSFYLLVPNQSEKFSLIQGEMRKINYGWKA